MKTRLLAAASFGAAWLGLAGVASAQSNDEAEVDVLATIVAAEAGLDLGSHIARQLTPEIGAAHDLILVMEPGHRAEIARRMPQLSGRVMLFDQWTGAKGIADPYRRSEAVHRETRDRIIAAGAAWAARLSPKAV